MYRLGVLFLVALVCGALLSPVLAPFDPDEQYLGGAILPPGAADADGRLHILGTDSLGRDVLSRLIFGSRVSLVVATSIVLAACVIGGLAGLTVGYCGGLTDAVLMRIADVQLALPFILLVVAVMAALGPGINKMVLVLILATWATYARLARGLALSVRELDFITAARSLGCPPHRILLRHLLPNVVGGLSVVATLETAQMVVVEAALSYLGLGVQPPTASWGSMLADGRSYLYTAWWLSTFPGMAIFLTVLSINLVGTELRERMDPKLKRARAVGERVSAQGAGQQARSGALLAAPAAPVAVPDQTG